MAGGPRTRARPRRWHRRQLPEMAPGASRCGQARRSARGRPAPGAGALARRRARQGLARPRRPASRETPRPEAAAQTLARHELTGGAVTRPLALARAVGRGVGGKVKGYPRPPAPARHCPGLGPAAALPPRRPLQPLLAAGLLCCAARPGPAAGGSAPRWPGGTRPPRSRSGGSSPTPGHRSRPRGTGPWAALPGLLPSLSHPRRWGSPARGGERVAFSRGEMNGAVVANAQRAWVVCGSGRPSSCGNPV